MSLGATVGAGCADATGVGAGDGVRVVTGCGGGVAAGGRDDVARSAPVRSTPRRRRSAAVAISIATVRRTEPRRDSIDCIGSFSDTAIRRRVIDRAWASKPSRRSVTAPPPRRRPTPVRRRA